MLSKLTLKTSTEKVNSSMIYLIHCKNLSKGHNIPRLITIREKIKYKQKPYHWFSDWNQVLALSHSYELIFMSHFVYRMQLMSTSSHWTSTLYSNGLSFTLYKPWIVHYFSLFLKITLCYNLYSPKANIL
jgi:hypothetical protein